MYYACKSVVTPPLQTLHGLGLQKHVTLASGAAALIGLVERENRVMME